MLRYVGAGHLQQGCRSQGLLKVVTLCPRPQKSIGTPTTDPLMWLHVALRAITKQAPLGQCVPCRAEQAPWVALGKNLDRFCIRASPLQ